MPRRSALSVLLRIAVLAALTLGVGACGTDGPEPRGSNSVVLTSQESYDSVARWSSKTAVYLPSEYRVVYAMSDVRGMRHVEYYIHVSFLTRDAEFGEFLNNSGLRQVRELAQGEGLKNWLSPESSRPRSTADSELVELRRIGSQGIPVSIGYQLLAKVFPDKVELFAAPE